MAYGRYDSRRGQDPRSRQHEDFDRGSRDERGFLDRARDEVSSWFGDDESGRGRDRDDRQSERFANESTSRERAMPGDPNYDRFERSARFRDEGYRRPYTGRFGADTDRPGSPPDRGGTQREFTGMAGGMARVAPGRHDPDYSEWRSRQIEELDRDYDDFRRENQSRFDNEFSAWRGQRQTKRQMLNNISEHMEVVGSDGQPVGKVDWVKGDNVILAKGDSPDGRHHKIGCAKIDRVEDGKVILDCSAEDAKRQFARDDRGRALFERDEDREDGPHMLNRSFSGTY